jgi:hypothetical protein
MKCPNCVNEDMFYCTNLKDWVCKTCNYSKKKAIDGFFVDVEIFYKLLCLKKALYAPTTVKGSGGRIDGNWVRDCANTLDALLNYFEAVEL